MIFLIMHLTKETQTLDGLACVTGRDSESKSADSNEIEITPEMIEAGVATLLLFTSEDRFEVIASSVYEAMALLAPQVRNCAFSRT